MRLLVQILFILHLTAIGLSLGYAQEITEGTEPAAIDTASDVESNPQTETQDIDTDVDESEQDPICEDTSYLLGEENSNSPPFFSFLDEHQKLISNYVLLTVHGVDNFFANTNAIDEYTGSYLLLSLQNIWTEGHGSDFTPGIKFKVRLPNTEHKFKLVFESDPVEKTDAVDLQTRESPTLTNENRDTEYYTGIEGDFGKRKWKFRPSIGIKLHSPPDYYLRFRGERNILLEKWRLHLNQTFYWFDSTGFGSDSLMRWDRPLTNKFLFRSDSFVRYTDLYDYYDLYQTVELIHTLSHKRAITYKAGVFGITEPNTHVTHYLLNALYRQNIHKDYLFLDLQPQIIFAKELGFESQYELLVRIEMFYRG